MAAAAKETREPLPSELRKKYISAKATYEALWQSQLDEWEHEPPPVPKFQEMVGTEHFIPESRLARVKTGGAGSFATVDICWLRSEDGRPDQLVAVKRLKPNVAVNLNDLANEGKILRTLRHRNITSLIGVGASLSPRDSAQDESGNPGPQESYYIVQEYIDGGTLKQKVLQQMADPERLTYSYADALAWAEEVADGLAYLHSYNPQIIHRDVKLDNVLLRNFGLAVSVMNPTLGSDMRRSRLPRDLPSCPSRVHTQMSRKDRGEAVDDDAVAAKAAALDAALTAHPLPGQALGARAGGAADGRRYADAADAPSTVFDLTGRTGSYLYMSPEVTRCEPYNDRADVFSFGVLLYELLAREITAAAVLATARAGDSEICELYAHKVAEGYRRPLPEDWPQPLRQLLSECWAPGAAGRPAMRQVAVRLAAIRASPELQARPASLNIQEWDRRSVAQIHGHGCCPMCAVM